MTTRTVTVATPEEAFSVLKAEAREFIAAHGVLSRVEWGEMGDLHRAAFAAAGREHDAEVAWGALARHDADGAMDAALNRAVRA